MAAAASALPLPSRAFPAGRPALRRLGALACVALGHLGLVIAATQWSAATPRPATPAPVPIAVLLPPEPVPPAIVEPARRPPEPLPPSRKPLAAPSPAPQPAPVATEPVREPPPSPVALAAAPATPEPRPAAIGVTPAASGTPPAPRVTEGLEPARTAVVSAAPRVGPRIDASWSGNQPPPYPTMARRLGEEGEVRLDVHVNADGAVTEVRLRRSSGSELLDRTAIDTVRKWRFRPATVDGKPVAEWYHDWKWTFRLEG